MPDFKSSQERDKWMVDHADYFTVGRRSKGRYERFELPTLPEAEKLAGRMANEAKAPYMIYAVAGIHDAFVKAVKPSTF